jgi:hypothetical protein
MSAAVLQSWDRGLRRSGHGGGGQAERAGDPLGHQFGPGAAAQLADQDAEHGQGEVGVVVAAVVGQHPLDPGQVGEQGGRVRRDQRVPHVAVRFALEAGRVREHPADGGVAVRGHVQVLADRVVEVEQPVVARLHHERGGERLGDRADPEAGVGAERMAGRAGGADRTGPEVAVGPVQRHREGGDATGGLRLADRPFVPCMRAHRSIVGRHRAR